MFGLWRGGYRDSVMQYDMLEFFQSWQFSASLVVQKVEDYVFAWLWTDAHPFKYMTIFCLGSMNLAALSSHLVHICLERNQCFLQVIKVNYAFQTVTQLGNYVTIIL